MAKKLIGILVAIIVIVLIYFLNKPLGTTPALGMFLSPTHGFWKSTSNTETRNQSIEINV